MLSSDRTFLVLPQNLDLTRLTTPLLPTTIGTYVGTYHSEERGERKKKNHRDARSCNSRRARETTETRREDERYEIKTDDVENLWTMRELPFI